MRKLSKRLVFGGAMLYTAVNLISCGSESNKNEPKAEQRTIKTDEGNFSIEEQKSHLEAQMASLATEIKSKCVVVESGGVSVEVYAPNSVSGVLEPVILQYVAKNGNKICQGNLGAYAELSGKLNGLNQPQSFLPASSRELFADLNQSRGQRVKYLV